MDMKTGEITHMTEGQAEKIKTTLLNTREVNVLKLIPQAQRAAELAWLRFCKMASMVNHRMIFIAGYNQGRADEVFIQSEPKT